MGEQSEPGNFFAQTTPTFHIHKLLEVVHSMLTIAKNDHSSIPNSLPHGKKPCDYF